MELELGERIDLREVDDNLSDIEGDFIVVDGVVQRYEENPDLKYGDRSTLYEWFVTAYPESPVAKSFQKMGLRAVELGGTFHTALFEGDLDKALLYADLENRQRLIKILKDRKGYPVNIDEEEIKENHGEDKIVTEDGEESMSWARVMEEVRGEE